MNNIYNYTKQDLENYFLEIGETKFRAAQVFDWLYIKRVTSFDLMTNLKKDLIKYLKENFSLDTIKLVKKQSDVDVKKYLFELSTMFSLIFICKSFLKVSDSDNFKSSPNITT